MFHQICAYTHEDNKIITQGSLRISLRGIKKEFIHSFIHFLLDNPPKTKLLKTSTYNIAVFCTELYDTGKAAKCS